ncbi:MAG TPA: 30S ribosomal protein S19e [Candidatus Nanoarchaeia archaeon]|nr:30S ribosomal protein S19e [Candidatus Nanoarchaeia archaeon]
MASPFDVSPIELAKEVAQELKAKIQAPEWAKFVKTGVNKERPPAERDWWHIRAASVLRTIYKSGPVGVSKLRTRYGGAKSRGVRPNKFMKASGSVLRKIIQQLESAGLVAYKKDTVHKGRIITPAGLALLTKAADKIRAK